LINYAIYIIFGLINLLDLIRLDRCLGIGSGGARSVFREETPV